MHLDELDARRRRDPYFLGDGRDLFLGGVKFCCTTTAKSLLQRWLPSTYAGVAADASRRRMTQRRRRLSRRCIPATETGESGRPNGSMNRVQAPEEEGTEPSSRSIV